MTGRVLAVVGPSGVGKDALISGARVAGAGFHWARRTITRPETAGGEPYEGVSRAEFARRREAGLFALWWEAHGFAYGIAHAEFAPRAAGRDVLFNGSRGTLAQAAAAFPGLRVLHVTAPPDVLARRLAGRGRESAEDIAARLRRADYGLPACLPPDLDVVEIRNDASLDEGIARFLRALQPASG